jgi:hypothetical protein
MVWISLFPLVTVGAVWAVITILGFISYKRMPKP